MQESLDLLFCLGRAMPLSKMYVREASILKAISKPHIKSFFRVAFAKTVFDRKKKPLFYLYWYKSKTLFQLHKRIHTTNKIIFEHSCYIFQDTQNWRIQHWEELPNISLLCHDAWTNMNVEVKISGRSSLVPLYQTRREQMNEVSFFPFHLKSLIISLSVFCTIAHLTVLHGNDC